MPIASLRQQLSKDNRKRRSRHRFMIATTAIRYELTARSSTQLYIALRISWSPIVHTIDAAAHHTCHRFTETTAIKDNRKKTITTSLHDSKPQLSDMSLLHEAQPSCTSPRGFLGVLHRFMIATTAIRYELTARSSTQLYIASRISWSPTSLHDSNHSYQI